MDVQIGNLQAEAARITRCLEDVDALLETNEGRVLSNCLCSRHLGSTGQKDANSKAVHTKLTDLKRHIMILRTEVEASRMDDIRKGHRTEPTMRLEAKLQQLETRAREISRQLRQEHSGVQESKARLNQLRQDRLNHTANLEQIRHQVATAVEKRVATSKLVQCYLLACALDNTRNRI